MLYIGILGDENIGCDPHVHHLAPYSHTVDIGHITDMAETSRIIRRSDALLIICNNPDHATFINDIRPSRRTIPRRIVVLGCHPDTHPAIKEAAESIGAHFFPIPTPFSEFESIFAA